MNIISKVKRLVVNTKAFDRFALHQVQKKFPDEQIELLFSEKDEWIFRVGKSEWLVMPDNARLLSGDRPSDEEEEVFCYILDELYWKLID